MSEDDIVGTLEDKTTGESAPMRRGRSGLTLDLHERLVDAFRTEPSPYSVAAACRVAPSTLFRWLQKGRAGHPTYQKFALDVDAARNLHRSEWMDNVRQIADDESHRDRLRANLTLLARQFPDEFGDRDTVALDEHKAKKNEADFLKTLTPEELQLLKAINAKRLAADNE